MTTFIDGAAKGQRLSLIRTPIYLRVVHNTKSGKWDALNLLEDEANPNELIYAYKHTGLRGFACGRGKCSPIAEYAIIANQPTDMQMRSNEAWAKWCEGQPGL